MQDDSMERDRTKLVIMGLQEVEYLQTTEESGLTQVMGEKSNRKRKKQACNEEVEQGELSEERLALRLSLPSPEPAFSPPPRPQKHPSRKLSSKGTKPSRQTCPRVENIGDNVVDPPPYPWVTTRPTTVQTLDYLLRNEVHTIDGDIQCKKCFYKCKLWFDLDTEFKEISSFIVLTKSSMHDRAPDCWKTPTLLDCPRCNEPNMLKPVIPSDNRLINWLFLLLGQLLGCCTLDNLKYFCKYNQIHRTGAKDRLLYLTYFALCKQLDPDGPFDP